MAYETVEDVYAANRAIREKFKAAIADLSEAQLHARPDEQAWSIAQIVEHVAIVNEGMSRICAKLLSKAEAHGQENDGSVRIENEFLQPGSSAAEQKFQAPEMVHPSGNVSVAESLAKLDALQAHFDELRSKFESIDGTSHKFPHPLFGDLSAQEWLVLSGGHEARHLRQVKRILAELG